MRIFFLVKLCVSFVNFGFLLYFSPYLYQRLVVDNVTLNKYK